METKHAWLDRKTENKCLPPSEGPNMKEKQTFPTSLFPSSSHPWRASIPVSYMLSVSCLIKASLLNAMPRQKVC